MKFDTVPYNAGYSKKFFAFLPIKIKNEIKWLEKVIIIYTREDRGFFYRRWYFAENEEDRLIKLKTFKIAIKKYVSCCFIIKTWP